MQTKALLTDLLDFLWESPTPFHAVESAVTRLRLAGFRALDECESWGALESGGYYVVHGGSALAAFVVPDPSRVKAFHLIGAHTDSPNLRCKSVAPFEREGYAQLGVEVYGGALLNSWLDRDLGIAGRVVFADAQGRMDTRLVRFDRPLARVAQLAIHLDREVNERGLVLNKQTQMPPIVGMGESPDALRELCAQALGVGAGAMRAFELMLYDLARPTLGGLDDAFIFSARLDNLAMCHAALCALLAASGSDGDCVRMAVLFDHEEVGSQSATGAGSDFLPRLLERLSLAFRQSREEYLVTLARSVCLSADMAHALHPNYPDRHEPNHRPVLNGGPVLKVNAQQRYATSVLSGAMFESLCQEAEVPMQRYVHRTDLQCGSTIGPITSTLLGIPTVDVGNPMLSMHSVREMGGREDVACMVAVMTRFLELRSDLTSR